MSSMTAEIVLMWAAVSVYALGATLYAVGLVFAKPGVTRSATVASLSGLVPHALAIGVRWVRIGHGPYLGFYEVVSSMAFVSVAVLAALALRHRSLARLGVLVMPLAFLLIGGAMFAPKSELEITAKLASWWLTVHVAFAKLSYGAFTASFALALLYLLRERRKAGRFAEFAVKLPPQAVVDDLSFKFAAAGFLFLGMMIAAGAIWANEAWGRYWNWDPIETWSLVAWVVYAVYLHLRLTMGWTGRKAAWVAVAALPVVLFALIGVPLVYDSIHGAYLQGY
ncbi:MAG: cytochrome c biogenesis protein CcsA [Coriobacteriia bacterium]|nr:cytochrome c biogenesis protein CcsA [Coriobacteriia bacterium]